MYLKNKSETLDWTYIENECIKLGIAEFEKQSRELAFKIFGNSDNPELTEADAALLEHYLSSGTYGTLENSLKTQMKKFSEKTGSTSKFRFILSKLFPDMEYYKTYYPFFYRCKVLIPFFLVFRTVRGLIRNRKTIFYELNVIGKTNINE